MPTHYYAKIPGDETGCRRVFEFARKLGIETLISEPPPESLDLIEKFCDEYDIKLAIHNHGPKGSPEYWSPDKLLAHCANRSLRIGACPDLGYWMRAGIDPIAGIKKLGKRLITIQVHDLNELTPNGHDVPWGTGAGNTEAVIRTIEKQGITPTMFGLEFSHDFADNEPEAAACIKFFEQLASQGE